MTKYELERENAALRNELYSLRAFHKQWSPLVGSLEEIIQQKIDDAIVDLQSRN